MTNLIDFSNNCSKAHMAEKKLGLRVNPSMCLRNICIFSIHYCKCIIIAQSKIIYSTNRYCRMIVTQKVSNLK